MNGTRFEVSQIRTIVVAMLENRSFDHMLGYLGMAPWNKDRPAVDGLRDDPTWLNAHANVYNGQAVAPFRLTDATLQIPDPPHTRAAIALQIGTVQQGLYPMDGFVASYAKAYGFDPHNLPPVMGYYTPAEVPVTAFFADQFAVCDHWFASLPASTQPNRLIAMSGDSCIADNTFPLPDQDLVYNWLKREGMSWRVYHEWVPFFMMMPKWSLAAAVDGQFQWSSKLAHDVQEESDATFPHVIFVEPIYQDAPHLNAASDAHPSATIHRSEAFLRQVYLALTSNPERWKRTVLIVTYDEHGGFYDHVSPMNIAYGPPADGNYTDGFVSSGVRVPALIVSPFVLPGQVYQGELDHISILKFIASVFNVSVPASVSNRDVGSVLDVLDAASADLPAARSDIPAPPLIDDVPTEPLTPNERAFQSAIQQLLRDHPDEARVKFPQLWQFAKWV